MPAASAHPLPPSALLLAETAPSPGKVIAAFAAAALLHAGLVAAIALWKPAEKVAPPGENEITLDMAPAASAAAIATAPDATEITPDVAPGTEVEEIVEEVEEVEQPEPVTAEETPFEAPTEATSTSPTEVAETMPDTPAEVMPAEVAEAKPVEAEPEEVSEAEPVEAEAAVTTETEPVETAAAEVASSEAVETFDLPVEVEPEVALAAPVAVETEVEPEAVTAAEVVPEPEKAVEPKPVETPKPKVAVKARERAPVVRSAKPVEKKPRAARASAASTASAGTTDDIGGRAASADPNALNRYTQQVRAAIERRKRSPDGAGDGVVRVRFTLDRAGRVTSAAVVQSSGSETLDSTAMSILRAAAIPAMPDTVAHAKLTLTVPIRFKAR